jgi:hypothetical protein
MAQNTLLLVKILKTIVLQMKKQELTQNIDIIFAPLAFVYIYL